MVPGERDYPVNAKVSREAARRLKQISLKRNMSYGEVLDGLIMGVPLPTADWEEPLQDALSRITTLEAQVSALLSASTMIADTKMLSSVAGVAPSALESDLSAFQEQRIVEAVSNKIVAEIAPGAAVDIIEREAAEAFSSILPARELRQVKKSVNSLPNGDPYMAF